MTRIYLARHGQDVDNVNKILNGHRDMELTEVGVAQAHKSAQHVSELGLHFDAVYASPLKRAFETARIIATESNQPNPVALQLLIERDFGVMTGIPISEIEARCSPEILKAELITYFLSPEGAETFPDLMQRGQQVIDFVSSKHPTGSVLLVSHGDIGKMIYAAYYKLPWKNVLLNFHFGNTEILLLSEDSPPEETHLFKIEQHNH